MTAAATGPAPPVEPHPRSTRDACRKVAHVMGMPISLALRGRHARDRKGEAAWQSALDTLREADRVFSTFRDDSYVVRLGRGEVELLDCPAEVAEVLSIGEVARQQSDGAFDVWRGSGRGRRLDPSGVVKGWAVERAFRPFEHLADTDACLSAGGDLVCRVGRAGSSAWQIGIEDPFDRSRIVAVVPVTDGAVATSGISWRGAHIVDARTGQAPAAVASVTVVGDSLTWVDVEATTAFARGADALRWLSGRQGRCGLVVWSDHRVEVFPALQEAAAESRA